MLSYITARTSSKKNIYKTSVELYYDKNIVKRTDKTSVVAVITTSNTTKRTDKTSVVLYYDKNIVKRTDKTSVELYLRQEHSKKNIQDKC